MTTVKIAQEFFNLSMIFYLLNFVYADQLVEGAYYGKDCVGPPDTIYTFQTVNTYSYIQWSPSLNETWPPYFKFHSDEVSAYDTGLVYVQMPGQTCIVTTDYSLSKPYWSGYTLYYSGGYSLDTVPKAANGVSYCYLRSDNFNVTTNLNGYLSAYFRPNNNNCYDDSYRCFSNGTFQYFVGPGCTGAYESIQLSTTLTLVKSPNLGNISVQYYEVANATLFFSWLDATPVESLVPKFDIAMDYVALIGYIFSLGLGSYVLCYSILLARRARKILVTQVVTIISALFWLLDFAISVAFWSLTVTDFKIIAWLSEWTSIAGGIASYCSCYLTSFLVSEVLFHYYQEQMRIIMPIALALLHFGFYGGAYFVYFLDAGGYPWRFITPLQLWTKYIIYWSFFMYIFNSVTPILVAVKILYLHSDKASIKTLDKVDPHLKYYLIGQLVSFATYATIFYMKKYTAFPYSDFIVIDLGGITSVTFSVHSYLTGKIYRVITKSAKKSTTHMSDTNATKQGPKSGKEITVQRDQESKV